MQAVCAKCSRLMCRAVVLFLVAECAQTTPMIAPLPGDPNVSIDGSVAFFKSGESNPTQPNPPGTRPSCGPSPPGPPLPPLVWLRRVVPVGGGGGPAGGWGGGPSQRFVISGLWVTGVSAPRASASSWLPPSPLLGAVPPLRDPRGDGGEIALGRGTRACRGDVPRRWSFPIPLCPPPGTIPAGRGRQLRRCLCGGRGCGGGAFLWR